MPRVVDLSKPNLSDWGEERLPRPVYGEREVTDEELGILARDADGPVRFDAHFSSLSRPGREDADRVHAWLSDNATGPWLWMESWSNNGHALDAHVYVEREPDRRAFAEAHSALFEVRRVDPGQAERIALHRGALPFHGPLESFGRWCRDHAGFRHLPSDDLGPEGYRYEITHPAIAAAFLSLYAPARVSEGNGGSTIVSGTEPPGSRRDRTYLWLDRNAAVGNVSGGPTPEGYRWSVPVRQPDVAAALARDWGHAFDASPDGATFSAADYPKVAPREVPGDFLAYLAGEREDYEAPHLSTEAAAFRTVPAGPSGP